MMKKTLAIFGISYVISCMQCSSNNNEQEFLPSSETNNPGLSIDDQFQHVDPIINLINLPTYTLAYDSFQLDKETDVQIYSVGEILYDISDQEKKYYLANDDIQLFFSLPAANAEKNIKRYIFNYHQSSQFTKERIDFQEGESEEFDYLAEIKIPWSALNIQEPSPNMKLSIEMELGDNDDGLIQKSKVAFGNTKEHQGDIPEIFRTLILGEKIIKRGNDTIQSLRASPEIDGKKGREWKGITALPVDNLVYGVIKDKFDFSAFVSSAWDSENLYFLFEIKDSRRKMITAKKIKEREILVDYGYIENNQGDMVWKMTTKSSKWAGGAYRNQMTDTIIRLLAGKYKASYISDESHTYDNWNGDPPNCPFYGLVLYPIHRKE